MCDLLKGSSVQHFTARLQAQTENQPTKATKRSFRGRMRGQSEGEDRFRCLTSAFSQLLQLSSIHAFNVAVLWILSQV